MQNDKFDEKLRLHSADIPYETKNAMIFVVDTADFAWAGVQSVFGDAAKPEHALEILRYILYRINYLQAKKEDEV